VTTTVIQHARDRAVATDQPPVISVRNLSKLFTLHERDVSFDAFADISFDAFAGQITVLTGASGSGKSSVLRCIHRTYLTTGGELVYRTRDGAAVDLCRVNEQWMLELRRGEIRSVGQFLRVLPRKSALDVVARPLLELGEDESASRDKAQSMLQWVHLPERLHTLSPATFSGGERQLVNLAMAMIVRPRLLLLDEPTASLDPTSTGHVVEVIEQLRTEDVAVIAVFHNRTLVKRLADVHINMSGGIRWDDEE